MQAVETAHEVGDAWRSGRADALPRPDQASGRQKISDAATAECAPNVSSAPRLSQAACARTVLRAETDSSPASLGCPLLRREAHARMLGNGLCTRPVELDCRMESACETCAYFRIGVQFLPILTRQRDHAQQHGQAKRAELFDRRIQRVEPDPETNKPS